MRRSNQLAVATALILGFASAAVAQPVIVELNGTEFPRSRRVAVTGSGFGAAEGQILIAGVEAWTTTWTDERIVTYVPEGAPLGPAMLQVVAGGESSNAVALTVTERESYGRVRWFFEAEEDNLWWRPAVAPNGTIYLHSHNATGGLIYALTRNGGLKWVQKVNGFPHVPPTAGPDNALYVGSTGRIFRIAPNGQISWTFDGIDIKGSPTVGPDGMLFGAFEVIPGAFGIDPATGGLEWENRGDPVLRGYGMLGTEIRFGRPGPGEPIDRFYVFWDLLWAFSLEGEQLFIGSLVNGISAYEPVVGADGTVYAPNYQAAQLAAMDPSDGSLLWSEDGPWLAHISDLEIGPDDMLYFIGDSTWIEAFNPHTQSSKWRHDTGIYLDRPTITPDGSTLIVTGGGSQEQLPVVKGFRTNNGHELWSQNLQEVWDPAFRIVPVHHPRMSLDGATAYVPTLTLQWPVSDGDPRSFLFAIEVDDEAPPVGDVDGNGAVDFSDLLIVLSNWGPCGDPCPADVDGDGNVGFEDLLAVLSGWS